VPASFSSFNGLNTSVAVPPAFAVDGSSSTCALAALVPTASHRDAIISAPSQTGLILRPLMVLGFSWLM